MYRVKLSVDLPHHDLTYEENHSRKKSLTDVWQLRAEVHRRDTHFFRGYNTRGHTAYGTERPNFTMNFHKSLRTREMTHEELLVVA